LAMKHSAWSLPIRRAQNLIWLGLTLPLALTGCHRKHYEKLMGDTSSRGSTSPGGTSFSGSISFLTAAKSAVRYPCLSPRNPDWRCPDSATNAEAVLITDPQRWNAMKREFIDLRLPVDINRQVVLIVMNREYTDAGHPVTITEAREDGGMLVISAEEEVPADCATIPILNRAYHLVTIDRGDISRPDLQPVLQLRTRLMDCNTLETVAMGAITDPSLWFNVTSPAVFIASNRTEWEQLSSHIATPRKSLPPIDFAIKIAVVIVDTPRGDGGKPVWVESAGGFVLDGVLKFAAIRFNGCAGMQIPGQQFHAFTIERPWEERYKPTLLVLDNPGCQT